MNLGGTETYLMNIYRNIDRKKVQFDFLTYYDKDEKGFYDDEILSLGGEIHNLRPIKKTSLLQSIQEIRNLININKYNIVHSHTTFSSGFSMIASYLEKCNIRIAHAHNTGTGDTSIKAKLYESIMRVIINTFANNFCACSKNASKFLFQKNNFNYMPNAVDLNKFIFTKKNNDKIKESLGIPNNHKVIGHIGRFGKAKNHNFIIDLFSNVLKKDSNCTLVLIGEGNTRKDIEEKAKELCIYENIRFLGLRNDIPVLMKLFDIFLLPSNYEGFGIVLLEAQACGLNCIVSENIQPEVDLGLNLIEWISLSDVDKWVCAIFRNYNSIGIDQKVIQNKILFSEFNINKVVDKFYKLYGIR